MSIYRNLLDAGWTHDQVEEVRQHINSLDWTFYEYDDNHRYARPDNEEEQRNYDQSRDDGCCGFYDVTLPSGIRIGFNYGH